MVDFLNLLSLSIYQQKKYLKNLVYLQMCLYAEMHVVF